VCNKILFKLTEGDFVPQFVVEGASDISEDLSDSEDELPEEDLQVDDLFHDSDSDDEY
jgi:hypothetical protein